MDSALSYNGNRLWKKNRREERVIISRSLEQDHDSGKNDRKND